MRLGPLVILSWLEDCVIIRVLHCAGACISRTLNLTIFFRVFQIRVAISEYSLEQRSLGVSWLGAVHGHWWACGCCSLLCHVASGTVLSSVSTSLCPGHCFLQKYIQRQSLRGKGVSGTTAVLMISVPEVLLHALVIAVESSSQHAVLSKISRVSNISFLLTYKYIRLN